jgi:hypothetical protein
MKALSRSYVRCAIYTRKSSEEGLEQSFNSLQAQREACEAYISSQRHEGWQVVANKYDDGGFSGGNMNRPALKQLRFGMGSAFLHGSLVEILAGPIGKRENAPRDALEN